jgi:hypothetical protein
MYSTPRLAYREGYEDGRRHSLAGKPILSSPSDYGNGFLDGNPPESSSSVPKLSNTIGPLAHGFGGVRGCCHHKFVPETLLVIFASGRSDAVITRKVSPRNL